MDDVELSLTENKNLMLHSLAQSTSKALHNYAYEKKQKIDDLNRNTMSDRWGDEIVKTILVNIHNLNM